MRFFRTQVAGSHCRLGLLFARGGRLGGVDLFWRLAAGKDVKVGEARDGLQALSMSASALFSSLGMS